MCSHEHHTLPSEIVDPTLQSCCERDREQQRTIEEYKQTLLRDDPTQTRQNITRDAVVRDVDRLQASLHSESSSDDDDIVELLRRQRLQELRQSLSPKENTVLHVDEHVLMATLEKDTSTDTVCCLIQPSFSRRADLLEYIMSIADKYVQYRFVVCQLQQHSRMPSLLGHRAGSPDTVILLLCHHVVVASITVLDDDAWSEKHIENSIISCVDSHTCISTTVKGNSSSEEEEELEPCTMCGRRYPHQHV